MTTTFELASATDRSQAFGISRVVDPCSVYNTLSRVPAVRVLTAAHAVVTHADTARISATSSLVASALSDTDLRAERIATLRQSIASGTYHVSADTVASSLLESAIADR